MDALLSLGEDSHFAGNSAGSGTMWVVLDEGLENTEASSRASTLSNTEAAMAAVGRSGTGQATVGTDSTDGGKADSGTWTAGPITETTDPKLSVGDAGGKPVLHKLTCTFSFSGTKANAAVVDSSTVVLSPNPTALHVGQQDVLLDGDSAKDAFGNTVAVQVSGGSTLTSSTRDPG